MTTAVSAGEIDEGDSLCRFKYGNELASIGPMPPIQPAGGTACRIVHNPILAKDFLPQAKLRELDTVTCSSWALSMFKNHNAAKKKLDSMVSRHPKLRE